MPTPGGGNGSGNDGSLQGYDSNGVFTGEGGQISSTNPDGATLSDYEGSADIPESPGTCTPAQHAALQSEVNNQCKYQMRSCKSRALSCTEYNKRIQANLQCAKARERINSICFNGGDSGHRLAAARAWISAGQCAQRMREKQCDEDCLQ